MLFSSNDRARLARIEADVKTAIESFHFKESLDRLEASVAELLEVAKSYQKGMTVEEQKAAAKQLDGMTERMRDLKDGTEKPKDAASDFE